MEENRSPRNMRRFQQACANFEDALLKLPNLQSFTADFTSYWNTWRNIEGIDDEEYPDTALPERVAQLAFILRALGRRNSISGSLVSLKLHLQETYPWWSLQDLGKAWMPPGDDGTDDDGTDDEPDDDAEPDDNDEPKLAPQAIINQSQVLVQNAFIHLTNFHLSLTTDEDEGNKNLRELARIINKSKNLVRFTLSTWNRVGNICTDPDILGAINTGSQWPMLQELELQGLRFLSESLLCTLSHLASTLKSLEVKQCTLANNKDLWTDFYKQLRLVPFERLHHLNFQECRQFASDRKALSKPLESWSWTDSLVMHFMDGHRVGFSSEIYDYILKKTDIMPPLRTYSYYSTETLAHFNKSSNASSNPLNALDALDDGVIFGI